MCITIGRFGVDSTIAVLALMGERHLLVAVLIDISLLFRGDIVLLQASVSERVLLAGGSFVTSNTLQGHVTSSLHYKLLVYS